METSWLVVRSRKFPLSFHLDRRVPSVLLGLCLVILATMVLSIAQGEYPIPPLEVVKTLAGVQLQNPDYPFLIYTLRLPRSIAAVLVGMSLAIAGTITQGITRNPLAAPGIIGVNAGASLAAVGLIVLIPDAPVYTLPLAAFGGAMVIAGLIYILAWQGGSSPVRLILIGVGFSLIAGALTNLLITFGDISNVSQALVWMAGSVYGRNWLQVYALLPWLLGFGTLALVLTRELNLLSLGDDVARSLGSSTELQRGLLLLASAALAGAAVATAGAVGFVGLMAPHLARQLVGPSHEGLLPTAALMGGMVVVVADLAGRLLFAPLELPCGVVTAVIGAPYFLYLLIRKKQH